MCPAVYDGAWTYQGKDECFIFHLLNSSHEHTFGPGNTMVPTDAPEQDDSISANPASYLTEPPHEHEDGCEGGTGAELDTVAAVWNETLPGCICSSGFSAGLRRRLEDRGQASQKPTCCCRGRDSRTFMRATCLHCCPESSPLWTHVESPLQWEEPGDLLISALKTSSDEDQEVSTQRRLWSHQLLSSLYWLRVSEKHGQMGLSLLSVLRADSRVSENDCCVWHVY